MARKSEYDHKMHPEVLEILAEARSRKISEGWKSKARGVYRKYVDELDGVEGFSF